MQLIKLSFGVFVVLVGFLIILFSEKIILNFFKIRRDLSRKFLIMKIIGIILVISGFIIALN